MASMWLLSLLLLCEEEGGEVLGHLGGGSQWSRGLRATASGWGSALVAVAGQDKRKVAAEVLEVGS